MSHQTPDIRNLPEAEIDFHPQFFPKVDADRLFQELLDATAWRQDHLKIYGRSVPLPRLTAWYGDEGTSYRYSGLANEPLEWTPMLLEVKEKVEAASDDVFNSVLLNRYRNGQDSVSWHSDDEPEFGRNPVIASVSFGGTRTFQFRHKEHKDKRAAVELTHGSLLVMRGTTQEYWQHQIPKTTKGVAERLNLTFRLVRR